MRAMTEAEFLSRIDQHLAQGNEIMARSNEVMARSDETMARSNELHGGYRQFMRDIMRRLEIFGRDLSREMHEIRADMGTSSSSAS